MNRKRSHDDLEDADECLPISKRINSLHLEGKANGICFSESTQDLDVEDGPSLYAHRNSIPLGHDCASSSSMHVPQNVSQHPDGFYVSPNMMNSEILNLNGNRDLHSYSNQHQANTSQLCISQGPLAHHQMNMPPNLAASHYASGVNCHQPTFTTNHGHIHHEDVSICDDNSLEELPTGPYEPELGRMENPYYYSTNKLLYEAHLSRLQRIVPDYQLHS